MYQVNQSHSEASFSIGGEKKALRRHKIFDNLRQQIAKWSLMCNNIRTLSWPCGVMFSLQIIFASLITWNGNGNGKCRNNVNKFRTHVTWLRCYDNLITKMIEVLACTRIQLTNVFCRLVSCQEKHMSVYYVRNKSRWGILLFKKNNK